MALFFPEWIPWWLQLTIVGIIVIFGICFLLMPFSVFGVKSRLTYIDHQMEDIQAQLRVLLKRMPDGRDRMEFKLQPIQTGETESYHSDNDKLRDKPTSNTEHYYPPVPPRSRQTRFDPPKQEENIASKVVLSRSSSPEMSSQNDMNDAQEQTVPTPRQSHANSTVFTRDAKQPSPMPTGNRDQRIMASVRRDEQLYDPPSAPVKEERQEDTGGRRRAEPILRWPPR
ncbi:hypothetical protein [Commensalibacter oyaizuii]|uniref:Uncharacterized protein n=1 Tax=Commensalibacter oyaizuii TaxID=3043873 RepID=A0ABT6Q168_9PROT|nr:hypothetical protein [Commensalibacter sp. TBRC 16381]MDI2090745.1 hypothetical protein [Commensalibacter sp. TBRC 16381]